MIDMSALAPAVWGEAGALAYGLTMTIQAFRTAGTGPGARTEALASLALGVFVGPIAATVFVSAVLWLMPRLDPRAAEVTLGLIAVPGLPRFAATAQRLLFSRMGDDK